MAGKCGSCRHLKSYIDHPKYGTIEITHAKNVKLMHMLISECEPSAMYADCELDNLGYARNHEYTCRKYEPMERRCKNCGKVIAPEE